MSYQEVIAHLFEKFSNEILERLEANRFSFADGVLAFEDFYFV